MLALVLSAVLAPVASANPARDLTRTGIPGAVVLSGDRVYDSGDLRASDRFRVGSVTKTFVATVTLQLVAEGRLKLDQPVPEAGGAPLRTLLNHTSGVFNHAEDPQVFEQGLLKQWQPRELIAISRAHPPYFTPGAGFHYSNTNYVMLGAADRARDRAAARARAAAAHHRPARPARHELRRGPARPRRRPRLRRGPGLHRPEHELGGRVRARWSRPPATSARFYRALLTGRCSRPAQLAAMKTRRPGRRRLRPRAVHRQDPVRRAVGPQWHGAGLLRAGLRERGRPAPGRGARQPPAALASARRRPCSRAVVEAYCS